MTPPSAPVEPRPEQLVFARILRGGATAGFAALVAGFALYLGGVLPPFVRIADLPRYWGLPAARYLAETGLPGGWGWLGLVGHGDVLNFVGIAFLAGLTIVCYAGILPILLRRRDTAYCVIVVAELAILLLAASGLIAARH